VDGLIIKKKYLDLILKGEKMMEIRGNIPWSHKFKIIALIESGSGFVKGKCHLYAVTVLYGADWFEGHKKYHRVENKSLIKYKKTYAWWFCDIVKFDKPIPYKHPRGAQVWVKNVISKEE